MRIAFLLLLSLSTANLWAKDKPFCREETGSITKKIADFIITIRPRGNQDDVDLQCQAVIRNSNRKVIFSASDWELSIAPLKQATGSPRAPYIILEAYSGGAHCCWTYYIVSTAEPAGLVRKFENERGAAFSIDKKTGLMEIETMDGAFDYFAFLSHAETPFPDVYFRLEGKRLIDNSADHKPAYDKTIRQARKELASSDLQTFRALTKRETLEGDYSSRHTASKILEIVFAYLYSGRRAQAHQALVEMWPEFDQETMWEMILCTRRKGILTYARRRAP